MENNEIFKKKFALPRDDFSEPFDLQDAEIGFSVYKEQKDLKREGFKSIFHIYIKNEELRKKGDEKSINIRASYGKAEDGQIIVSSSDFEIGENWPIELFSRDEFFFNIRTYDLLRNKVSISGKEILDLVNNWHIKPGLWFRTKSKWFHIILAQFLKSLFYIISGTQYFFSGEKVNNINNISKNTISPPKKPGKLIKIFNYQVEARVAAIYAMIHLLIYSFFFSCSEGSLGTLNQPLISLSCGFIKSRFSFLTTIFNNTFATTMYVIVSLGLTEIIFSKLPRVYFSREILTFIQEKYFEMLFRKIKI
ncbi:MAG: hypothetical protein HYV51_03700 [Parcubacteria group bacterium]|nr:hypothetical protein [Parcubacteria group bacterium]